MLHAVRTHRNRPLAIAAATAALLATAVLAGSPARATEPHRLAVARVTVTGPARVGATLVAHHGAWTPGTRFLYRWRRDGTPIKGATTARYTVRPADYRHRLTVTVTGSKPGFLAVARRSAKQRVSAGVLTAGTVSLGGTAVVAGVLTARHSAWSAGASLRYQWYRGGGVIPGATGASYTPDSEDAGQRLGVRLTGSERGYASRTVASGTVLVAYGTLAAGVPTIAGTAQVGRTLAGQPGTWPSDTALAYQWLRDGAPLDGATVPRYTATAADAGHQLSLRVTGSRTGYVPASATSMPLTVAPAPGAGSADDQTTQPGNPDGPQSGPSKPMAETSVGILGVAVVGQQLGSAPGSWPAQTTLSYQWNRDGRAIPGATGNGYTPVAEDAGHTLTVTVTGSAPGYQTTSRTSAGLTVGLGTFPLGTVAVSGTAVSGSTLSAALSGWPDGTTPAFQWYSDSGAIDGATAESYTTVSADADHSLSVAVTVTRPGYQPVTVTSTGLPIADWYATAFGTFSTEVHTGYGDATFNLPSEARWALVTATFSGSGMFIVRSADSSGKTTSDLTIGSYGQPYSGIHLLSASNPNDPSSALTVSAPAESSWSITVSPVKSASDLPMHGRGDGVYRYDGSSNQELVTNSSSSYVIFTIDQYLPSGAATAAPDQLAAATSADGSFAGLVTAHAGPSLVVIASSATWSLTPQ